MPYYKLIMSSPKTFIDLFAGASGLSEGFVRNGFIPVGHIELDSEACYTIKTRMAFHYLEKNNSIEEYYKYQKGEISREQLYSLVPDNILNTVINAKISRYNIHRLFKQINLCARQQDIKKIDMIVGGPPCQSYSLIGRHKKDIHKDPRNTLYLLYGKFLKYYKPKVFVFENVLGLLSAGNKRFFQNVCRYYRKIGYEIFHKVLNASDYGVLQERRRLIIVGWQKKIGFGFPDIKKISNTWTTASIFSDLPKLKAGEGNMVAIYAGPSNDYLDYHEIRNGVNIITHHITRPHNLNDLSIYRIAIKTFQRGKRIKYNTLPVRLITRKNLTSFLDRYKVVNDKGLSHTVIAHIAKDGHYYIHPDIEQCRSVSVREAARIQSFPDDYYFEGSRSSIFRQIGNAVPPLLSYAIAKGIKKQMGQL